MAPRNMRKFWLGYTYLLFTQGGDTSVPY